MVQYHGQNGIGTRKDGAPAMPCPKTGLSRTLCKTAQGSIVFENETSVPAAPPCCAARFTMAGVRSVSTVSIARLEEHGEATQSFMDGRALPNGGGIAMNCDGWNKANGNESGQGFRLATGPPKALHLQVYGD
jgi:hypothetical protein